MDAIELETDARKAILAAMKRRSVNANQLAIAVAPHVSRSQVYVYISGKSDLGTDKAKHLLAAVELVIVPK